MSYELMPDLVPMEEVHDVMRQINQQIFNQGLSKTKIDYYAKTANWFPFLTYDSKFSRILEKWQKIFDLEGDPVWTQILLQFPCDPLAPMPPWHIDDPPDDERIYKYVAGVCLTESDQLHGGIRFPDGNGVPHFNPGDAFVFTGDTAHSGGLNLSGEIRYAIYFRYLEKA